MADVELKTIKNTLGITQSVVYKGRQFILHPHGEETFDSEIANAFLAKCSPVVAEVKDQSIGETFAPELQEKTIWVANVTGNPDSPEKVKDRRYDKSAMRYQEVDIDNPNRKPRPIARELKGGHKQYTARDGGLVQESHPSRTWVVPTFRRVPMPSEVAEWFINRDAMTGPGRGAVIASRPRSNFEPDLSWSYEDMRNYARLTDPSMNIGPEETAIAREVKAEVDELAKANEWKPRKIELELRERGKEALRRVKSELFQRLYFRLVNPDYPLPSRGEYNEFVSGQTQADIEEAEVEAFLAKAERENKKAAKIIDQSEPAEAQV